MIIADKRSQDKSNETPEVNKNNIHTTYHYFTTSYDTITARMPLECLKYDNGWRCRVDHIEGRYGNRLYIEQKGFGDIRVSGSYAKFSQGHNLWTPLTADGPMNLPDLCSLVFQQVANALELPITERDKAKWRAGDFPVSRIDVARGIDLGTHDVVEKILRLVKDYGHSSRQKITEEGRRNKTRYVGKNSNVVSLKLYHKGSELDEHSPLSFRLNNRQELREYSEGLIRVEATLRKPFLEKMKLDRASAWIDHTTAVRVLNSRMDILEIRDMMKLDDAIVEQLPERLANVYDVCLNGRDLSKRYSKPTFNRHKSELLKYGIDISKQRLHIVQDENVYVLGFPAKSLLTGIGKPIPEWSESLIA